MKNGRTIGRILFLLLLAVGAGLLIFCFPPAIETSLFALIGEKDLDVPEAIRNRSATQLQILFSAPDFDRARAVADRFHDALDRSDFESVRFKTDGDELQTYLDFYRRHAGGLMSDADRKTLQAGEGKRLALRTLHRLYGSPAPPLFPLDADPFGVLGGFVASLPLSFSGWRPEEGYLTAERDGRVYLLMALTVPEKRATDLAWLPQMVARLSALRDALAAPDVAILFCGVPFHTVEVSERCRKDIRLLSAFSILFILCVAWGAFRSFRFLPLFLFSLALSTLGGLIALGAVFRSIHLLACVFGTTLLGLTIDYSFHWLLAARGTEPAAPGKIRRNLFASYLTTEVTFLPLAFSGLPVLAQIAILMGAGLTVALITILLFYPEPQPMPVSHPPYLPNLRWLLLPLAGVIVWGCMKVRFETPVGELHQPSPALMEAERLFRTLSGSDEAGKGLLLVRGGTLEDVLEREESIPLPPDLPRLSRFLPSRSRRLADDALVRRLYRDEGGDLARKLKLDKPLTPPSEPEAWEASEVPRAWTASFLYPFDGGVYSLIPQADSQTPLPQGAAFYAPTRILADLMARYERLTRRFLLVTAVALLAVLGALFRRRMPVIVLPSLGATLAVFAGIALSGQSVNLFHLLACFMVIGMSLDYTIFLASGFHHALKSVFCSLLTSLAGFGALACVAFPLVRSIGQALGIGLSVSFLIAYAMLRPAPEKVEQGASPLGLTLAWWVYRLFGKRALDGLGGMIAGCVWLTNRRVRHEAKRFSRLRLFTQGMIDKLVVMADGKDQPVVELAGGTGDGIRFCQAVEAKRGVFVISSHLGTVEVLPALARCPTRFHAFMKVEQTGVFNAFYARRAHRPEVSIHPLASFGIGEVFTVGDWLDRGDCVLMAGDRGYGKSRKRTFLSREVDFPEGVFRLSRALDHPVFFVACVRDAPNHYRVEVREAADDADLLDQYTAFLEPLVRCYREQWFNWSVPCESD